MIAEPGSIKVGVVPTWLLFVTKKLVSVDGKNSKSKGNTPAPISCVQYAMLYRATTGNMPNKLGFIYYRYPYGMENEGVIRRC